jgi:hypothetical protein
VNVAAELVIETMGAIVSELIVQTSATVDVLPAGSAARTVNLCCPAERPLNDFGDVHELNEFASIWHSNDDPASLEEKENDPDFVVVLNDGASVNEMMGGVASTVHE